LITRLGRAAADVLSRPALYWAIAAAFWLRVAILTLLTPRRPDTEGMWEGAHAYLTAPSHMYDAAADYLSRLHIIAPPGGLDAFVSPPPLALLAVPVALLPKNVGVQVWTGMDAIALLVGLALLYRVIGTRHPLARPALAGAAAGLAAALKYYPAAMVIGPRPEHRVRYAVALAIVLVAVTAVSFLPLGLGGTWFYFQHVLLPSLGSHNPDCAYDSVRTLFMRTIGGEEYAQPSGSGYVLVTSPLHLPALALALSYLSAPAFAAGAAWGAWRSGWNPAYGMSLGFALGALIPNEVWPYQWLPLLPLVLLIAVRGIERRKVGVLVLLGLFLVAFFRQPCELAFPNLWTLAAIGVFALGVWQNPLFRSGLVLEDGHGAQR
jgi:hypothetical protein